LHGRGEKISVRAWKLLPPGLMPIHDDASGVGVGTEDFFGTPSNSFFFFLQHGNNLSGVRVIIYVGTKEVRTMELTELEAQAVKSIYTDYHAGATNADEALHALEQLINGGLTPCDKCGDKIQTDTHAEELGMCVDCSNAYFSHEDED